ncbi:hypothetical protein WJX73_005535 [Symbiochloris irregularis]|uniref:Uncharacterized protein n=1 Tax=Symbiochloris irregularis TaxID=706552 RepID=A0AAW1NJI8_9CHLO
MGAAAKISLLVATVLCASVSGAWAQQNCSVLAEIIRISPEYAYTLLNYTAGLETTEEELDGDSVAYTFFVPAGPRVPYSEFFRNISFGYTPETADAIFNKSVLMQTLPNPYTVDELLQFSADNFNDYKYDEFNTGGETIPFYGNGTALTIEPYEAPEKPYVHG